MSSIDGDTIQKASPFSERPRERRDLGGAPCVVVAVAMI